MMGLVGAGKKRKMIQGDRGVRTDSELISWAMSTLDTPRGKAPTDDLRCDRLKDGDEHSVEQEETKLQGKKNKQGLSVRYPVATDPKARCLSSPSKYRGARISV